MEVLEDYRVLGGQERPGPAPVLRVVPVKNMVPSRSPIITATRLLSGQATPPKFR